MKLSIPFLIKPFIFTVPALAASRESAESYLVKGLEEIEPAFATFQGKMYSGLVSTSEEGKGTEEGALFFWLFEPTKPVVPDSLVIWLNGGPGCSSFIGLLTENGPVTVPLTAAGDACLNESAPLVPNMYAWTNASNVLFVEQPMGTGFSFGPEPNDEADLSRDFYHFLQNFYHIFPNLLPKSLFFFGESYAGTYVPSIAHHIHQQNKAIEHNSHKYFINLAGIGIGNGVVDAEVQGPVVIDYAYWHGMIDETTKKNLYGMWDDCIEGLRYVSPLHPFNTPDECGVMEAVLSASGQGAKHDQILNGPNTYDVTTWEIYHAPFSENGTITRFLNNEAVRQVLHAPRFVGTGDEEWAVCIPGSGRRRKLLLDNDRPLTMLPYMTTLLDEAGIRVLLYNGDRDLSCCVQGTEALLDKLNWHGSDGWHSQENRRHLWMVKGESNKDEMAGYSKAYANLQFVVVYNSGHMVPTNQPRRSLDLLVRFLQNVSFSDIVLPAFAQPDGGSMKQDTGEATTAKTSSHTFGKILLFFVGIAVGASCALLYASLEKRALYYSRSTSESDAEETEMEAQSGRLQAQKEIEPFLGDRKYGAL